MYIEPAKYSSDFRTKVVLEYIKAENNIACQERVCRKFDLSHDLVSLWEALFLREFGHLIYVVEIARRGE